MANAGQDQGAHEIDQQRPCPGERERQWRGRHWGRELLPRHPDRGKAGNQDDASEYLADHGAARCTPRQRQEDQSIDRGIFKKVDRVCEECHRPDQKRNAEFNTKIGEVQ